MHNDCFRSLLSYAHVYGLVDHVLSLRLGPLDERCKMCQPALIVRAQFFDSGLRAFTSVFLCVVLGWRR